MRICYSEDFQMTLQRGLRHVIHWQPRAGYPHTYPLSFQNGGQLSGNGRQVASGLGTLQLYLLSSALVAVGSSLALDYRHVSLHSFDTVEAIRKQVWEKSSQEYNNVIKNYDITNCVLMVFQNEENSSSASKESGSRAPLSSWSIPAGLSLKEHSSKVSSTRVFPPRKLVRTLQATSDLSAAPWVGASQEQHRHTQDPRLAAYLNLPRASTTPQLQPDKAAHLSFPQLRTLLGSLVQVSDREGRKPGFSGPCKAQPTAVPAPAAGDWGAECHSPTDGGRKPALCTGFPGARAPGPLPLAGVRSRDQFSVLCPEL
ncbi:hypothetical protein STEG23_029769 [Scotinomys teguina]